MARPREHSMSCVHVCDNERVFLFTYTYISIYLHVSGLFNDEYNSPKEGKCTEAVVA
jgi:hypothetical protein